jgi:diadenosine tetraphosphate (Ap4A) HIT family hydrolase
MDLAAYEQRIRNGRCFVCGVVRGDPDYNHEQVVFEDDAHIAFLDRYPTLYGKVNAHVHWHIAPLPPGIPFERQQFHALMLDNGVIPWSATQAAALAAKLRAVLEHE